MRLVAELVTEYCPGEPTLVRAFEVILGRSAGGLGGRLQLEAVVLRLRFLKVVDMEVLRS